MLTIRPEQDEALREAALDRFEDEMVEHLRRFAPKHCEVLGETAVRKVIRLGMERAKGYGFTNRGPVRFYLELMMMFGSYFDTDLQLPWASRVLADSGITDQMARGDRLYHAFGEYASEVLGPGYRYEFEALRRLSQMGAEEPPGSVDRPEEFGAAALESLYPQKAAYLGEPVVREIVRQGIELAGRYFITTTKGAAVFVALFFTAGHRFDQDPVYPWIQATLEDHRFPDPDERARRLYARALTYLRHMVVYLEQRG